MVGNALIKTPEATSMKGKDTQPPQHYEALWARLWIPSCSPLNVLQPKEPEPRVHLWANRILIRGSEQLNVGVGSRRKGAQDPLSSPLPCGFQRKSLTEWEESSLKNVGVCGDLEHFTRFGASRAKSPWEGPDEK